MSPVVKILMVSISCSKLKVISVFNEVYKIHKNRTVFWIFFSVTALLDFYQWSKNAFEKSTIHHFSDDINQLHGTKTLSNMKFAMKAELNVLGQSYQHYVKNARIPSYSGPYFPALGLNMERCSVSLPLRIQS